MVQFVQKCKENFLGCDFQLWHRGGTDPTVEFSTLFFSILNTSLSEGDFSLQSDQGDVVLPLLMFGVNLNLGQLVITTIGTS